ncbi:hypothetical protein [Saccharomonospora sp.]|uniref:hypothetical protein n=1 Tax=Saccharomonospora sp. TaxID=33913 RepID=UPI00261CC2D7|nr:hypothetical protein [Saccharomonospora sp.]
MSETRIAQALARLAEHQELHLPLRRTDLLGRLVLRFLWRRQIKWQIETNLAVRDALEGLAESGRATTDRLRHEVAALQQHDQNLMAGLNQRLYSSVGRLQSQISELRLQIAESDERNDDVEQRLQKLEQQVEAHNATTRYDRLRHARLEKFLDELRATRPEPSASEVADRVPERESFLELAVSELLDGHVEGVRAARKPYLDVVSSARDSGATGPVFDMAPARGEWLELVRDAGLPYRAASDNRAIRRHCEELGLTIESGDASEQLAATAQRSLGAVTAFRYAERQQPTELARFVELAATALQPGGVLIVETASGAAEHAHDFHLDPFAVRPVHADFLRFLMESNGFSRVESRPVDPAVVQRGRYSLIAWR